jgi:hypothetical protein
MIHIDTDSIDTKAYNSYSREEEFSTSEGLPHECPSHQFQKNVCSGVTRGAVAVTMSVSMVA